MRSSEGCREGRRRRTSGGWREAMSGSLSGFAPFRSGSKPALHSAKHGTGLNRPLLLGRTAGQQHLAPPAVLSRPTLHSSVLSTLSRNSGTACSPSCDIPGCSTPLESAVLGVLLAHWPNTGSAERSPRAAFSSFPALGPRPVPGSGWARSGSSGHRDGWQVLGHLPR